MIANNPVLTLALAFAFFVVALFVFFGAIYVFRLKEIRTPYEQFVSWLDENGIEYEFSQLELPDENGDWYYPYLISFPAGDGSGYAYEFEFSEVDGSLISYGMDY